MFDTNYITALFFNSSRMVGCTFKTDMDPVARLDDTNEAAVEEGSHGLASRW